ncbi:MAG: FHA domain-containing protein [Myxococcota bacterium]|jgi:hypothetical protein|nr:FHA domain-containing protein [Myxococcota bacterium]
MNGMCERFSEVAKICPERPRVKGNAYCLIDKSLRIALAFMFAFSSIFFAAPASAQSVLEIFDINTKEAPKVRLYFSARAAKGDPIAGLKAENIKLLIDADEPPLSSKTLRAFKEGDQPVAVVVVFPVAKDYIEEFFGIRTNLSGFVRNFRPVDWVGAVAYDSKAQQYPAVTGADISGLADTIQNLTETDVIEPNMFSSLPTAINVLKQVEGVKLKYIVLVSNAEGAMVAVDAEATKRIQDFQKRAKDEDIRSLVIGYTPDGPDTLTYRKWLQQLSLGGYYEATRIDELPTQLNVVYDRIFQQYILDVEVNLEEDYWLEEGKYNFTVLAKVGSQELKGTDKAPWPALDKSYAWLVWLIVGIVAGLLVLFLIIMIIIKVARRKREQPEPGVMMMGGEAAQQEYNCEVCGKPIPSQLFGFEGEFCLVGGVPDCPYYAMPDQGKLQITRGPLADCTFFIKKEVTTVGSMIESDVALVDKSVSKKHAAIKVDEAKRYELRDFESTNGTYVNQEKVQRKFLKDGDTLRFGGVEVLFKLK